MTPHADTERRVHDRPMPPKPGLLAKLDDWLVRAAENARHHWSGRIIFTLVIVASLGLIAWSVHERLPLLRGSHAWIERLHHLRKEIAELQATLQSAPGDAQKLARAEQSVAPDLESVAAWMNERIASMRWKHSAVTWRLKGSLPLAGLDDVRALLIEVSIRDAHQIGFDRATKSLKNLTQGSWRTEWIGMNAQGGLDGLHELKALFRIWVRQSPDIDALAIQGEHA